MKPRNSQETLHLSVDILQTHVYPGAATKTLPAPAPGQLNPWRDYGETPGCSLLPKQFNYHLEDNHERSSVSCISTTPPPGRNRSPGAISRW